MAAGEAGGRPVVVGHDGSAAARRAVDWAVAEARALGCPLLVLRSVAPAPPSLTPAPLSATRLPGEAAGGGEDRGTVEAALTALAEELGREAADVVVRTAVAVEPAAAALSGAADAEDAWMAVVGLSGQGALSRAVLGSTANDLARTARRPVVVVRDTAAGERDEVVVGVADDGSSASAVDFAMAFAARHDLAVRAVHGWSPRPPEALGEAPLWNSYADRDRGPSDDVVAGWLAGAAAGYPDVPVRAEAVAAPPAQALVERTDRARLVVVGTHGRGAVRRALLGSVSNAAVHHAPCPVAVVRAG